MNLTHYTYSLENDFPNHIVASDRLSQEIAQSSIVIALDHIDTAGDDVVVWFKDPLALADVATLDDIVSVHTGEPLPQNTPMPVTLFGPSGEVAQNADRNLLVATQPRTGDAVTYVTHNFCDATTWFGDSVRVHDELATDTGDGLTWSLEHNPLIDMVHGKVQQEVIYSNDQRKANPSDPHGYLVTVTVDDAPVVERHAFWDSDGDYVVNYENGTLEFFTSRAGSVVKVSYSYANGSTFYVVPDDGFILDIEKAKCIFSEDFIMNDSVVFAMWGYADVFAPELGLPPGTKIPIAETEYKSLLQFVAESATNMPVLPALGGTSRRAMRCPWYSVHFYYGTVTRINSTYGMELRLSQARHIPNGGECTIATFYCSIKQATP